MLGGRVIHFRTHTKNHTIYAAGDDEDTHNLHGKNVFNFKSRNKPLLQGKVGAAFTSVGGHGRGFGGHEAILQSFHATFLQHGMVCPGFRALSVRLVLS